MHAACCGNVGAGLLSILLWHNVQSCFLCSGRLWSNFKALSVIFASEAPIMSDPGWLADGDGVAPGVVSSMARLGFLPQAYPATIAAAITAITASLTVLRVL